MDLELYLKAVTAGRDRLTQPYIIVDDFVSNLMPLRWYFLQEVFSHCKCPKCPHPPVHPWHRRPSHYQWTSPLHWHSPQPGSGSGRGQCTPATPGHCWDSLYTGTLTPWRRVQRGQTWGRGWDWWRTRTHRASLSPGAPHIQLCTCQHRVMYILIVFFVNVDWLK